MIRILFLRRDAAGPVDVPYAGRRHRLKLRLLLASGSGHVKSFGAGPARIGLNTLNLTGKVKGAGQLYEGGVRQWQKVKHRDQIDVVCAAVIGRRDRPSAIVAGIPIEGHLWIVDRSTQLAATASKALASHLHIPREDHPWPEEITPGTLDRFTKDKGPIRLTRVEPNVVEVSADVAWSGRSFRHPLRFLRPRPEMDPAAVRVPEHLERE